MKEESVSANLEVVQKEFDNAKSQDVRDALTRIFGNISYRTYKDIKTYADALKVLGIDEFGVSMLPIKDGVPFNFLNRLEVAHFAFVKLAVIRAAILKVEGFSKEDDEDGYMYYPWFTLWTQEELDEMNDKDKESVYLIPDELKLLLGSGGSFGGTSAGFGYTSTIGRCSNTYAIFAVLLCLPTRELAKYFGKQFIDLWCQYLNV